MPEETKEPNPVFPERNTPPGANSAPAGEPGASTTPGVKASAPEAAAKAPEVAKPDAVKATEPAKATAPTSDKPAAAAPKTDATATAKPTAPAAKPAPPKPEGPKPEPWDSELVRKLKSQYGSGIKEAATYVGQKYLVVDSSIVAEILLRMRDDELFDYCVDITAVHYPKREAQFDIVYILYSFHHNQRVRVKTQIKEGETLRSAFGIWPTADWLEREVYDMFGISFDGHPDLKRILLPDGWKGHPLRKDYPILQQDQEWVQINLGIESGQ